MTPNGASKVVRGEGRVKATWKKEATGPALRITEPAAFTTKLLGRGNEESSQGTNSARAAVEWIAC